MSRSRDNGRIDPNDYNGWVGDGVADATAALTWAINLLNSGSHDVLDLGGHAYKVTSTLPALVGENRIIEGHGAQLILNGTTTAIQLGNASTYCRWGIVRDLHINNDGTAAAQGYAIEMAATRDCFVSGITFDGLSGLVRVGRDQQSARSTFKDAIGSNSQGGPTDGLVRIEAGTTTRLENIHISTGGTPSSGAQVKFIPRVGTTVDSIWMTDCHFQIFSVGHGGNNVPDGKEYGIEFDNTNGNLFNVWIENGCVFDHTRTAGFYFHNSAGGTGQSRLIHFDNIRNDADFGHNLLIDNQSGQILESFHLMNSFMYNSEVGGSHVEIVTPGSMRGTNISSNTFLATDGQARGPAIIMRGDDFHVSENFVGRTAVPNPAGHSSIVNIADTGSTRFVVSNNIGRISGIPVVDSSVGASKSVTGNIT